MTSTPPIVACFGETLWDATPRGLFVGGAPYNVAYHLSQIGAGSLLITSVGADELGKLALQRASAAGIDISCVQISDTYPTGIADVFLDEDGNATYDIRHPAAWDDIQPTRLLLDKLANCQAFVYGTLAARSTVSRTALETFLDGFQGLKICDLNLRKSGDELPRARELARRSDALKLNEDELYRMADQNGSAGALELAMETVYQECGVSMLFVTRGHKPAAFYDGSRSLFASPPNFGPIADTIGAGDAFTAAITHGLLLGISLEECLDRAVRLGSYVATQSGAQPSYEPDAIFANLERSRR